MIMIFTHAVPARSLPRRYPMRCQWTSLAYLPGVRRFYSSSEGPLIIQTNIPAPNTGRIRVLALNRPAARNALSRALVSSLANEIADIQAQYGPNGEEVPVPENMGGSVGANLGHIRALVVSSAVDESFCAGADLKERKEMTQEETKEFRASLGNVLASLSSLQIPTISAISSVAFGGGLELALSTTFRVLASTASVGLPETRLGIIPGAGGTYRLPALIGTGRARDLVLTGRHVGAAEAYFLGIADRLVQVQLDEEATEKTSDQDEKAKRKALLAKARNAALAEAVRLAQEICEGGPIAIRAGLKAVNSASKEMENEMYQRVTATQDRKEALVAFKEKRKPVFTGR